MKISRELEAELIRKGAIVTPKPVWIGDDESVPGYSLGGVKSSGIPMSQDAPETGLVQTSVIVRARTFEAVLPIVTRSEVNEPPRKWRERNRRNGAAWRAVSKVLSFWLADLAPFAKHYFFGLPLGVAFTRLGGRKLDRSNLPTATKAVEDALAFFLGADDGSPLWVASWDQEPGGLVGVRIVLSMEALKLLSGEAL